LEVPGGTFYRSYSNSASGPSNLADPATVSTFRLDKYLVTVGRFRQFVSAWGGGAGWLPSAGSGVHTFLNGGLGLDATGGGYEPGWVASDNAQITPTDASLDCTSSLEPDEVAGSLYGTWTPTAGNQENLPITCENWYEAYAFCIWDGGFLPSEAELEYATAGGAAQREYPWGSTSPGKTNQYAIYDCYYPNGTGTCTGVASIAPVGSAPLGAGLWGHEDLAGSVWEWTLDWEAPYVSPCIDCANFTAAAGRATQGGNFNAWTGNFPPSRHLDAPNDPGAYAYGFRCARSP
jgi:formylglycine-generating enzyme required for sulfatase activity